MSSFFDRFKFKKAFSNVFEINIENLFHVFVAFDFPKIFDHNNLCIRVIVTQQATLN